MDIIHRFKSSAMFLFISPGEVVQVRIRLIQARVLGESDDLFPTSCPQNYYTLLKFYSSYFTHTSLHLYYSFSLLTCLLIRVVHGDCILHIIIIAALMTVTAAWYEVCQLPQWHLYRDRPNPS